jgi:WD40 repeat protein
LIGHDLYFYFLAMPQTLSVWEWPSASKTPSISAPIDGAQQHCVRFNPVDVRDIVSNGTSNVIFWNWTEDRIAAFHPPQGMNKLSTRTRILTATTFIPYTTKAVTATTSGHMICWDYPVSELVQSSGRDAIKMLKIVKCGINLLDTILDKFIVCGCSDGAVRFFDFQFRVVAWFEDLLSGYITSISFGELSNPNQSNNIQVQGSMEEFWVPEFIVGTSEGKILQLDSKTMEQLTSEKRRGRLLVSGFDAAIYALDAHPSLPLFAIGTMNGTLQMWDIDEHCITSTRNFLVGEKSNMNTNIGLNINIKNKEEITMEKNAIRCIKFGPKGLVLGK